LRPGLAKLFRVYAYQHGCNECSIVRHDQQKTEILAQRGFLELVCEEFQHQHEFMELALLTHMEFKRCPNQQTPLSLLSLYARFKFNSLVISDDDVKDVYK